MNRRTLLKVALVAGLMPVDARTNPACVADEADEAGQDWPHWRGPQRNGIIAEPSLWNGKEWLNSKPVWSAKVGEGASSPLVVGSSVYTLGRRGEQESVICLDAATGKPRWSKSYAAPPYGRQATGDEGLYSGPSSTPEFDGETSFLYTLGTDGELRCWKTSAGELEWRRNLYDDYKMPRRPQVGRSGRRDYGYTSSPLVHGEWLVVEAGSPEGVLVALDKRTGREAWKSAARGFAGHTGGIAPLSVDGAPCIAVLAFAGLVVTRLDGDQAGKTVAEYPWVTDFANSIASPVAHEDAVLITSDYNHGAMCKLRITRRGAEKLWEQPYSSKACTPVIHGGRIYVAWNRLRCLDWQTGEQVWEGPAVGDAGSCLVTSDDKLVVWSGRGDLFLAETSPAGTSRAAEPYRELARLKGLAHSEVWPHVVLSHGRYYCKDRLGHLSCFGR